MTKSQINELVIYQKNKQYMKTFLATLLLIISFQSISQINVGSNFHPGLMAGKLDTNKIEQLKKSHTIFVYRDIDSVDIKNLKEQITSIWTISDLQFYNFDEFLLKQKDFDESYSFITIVGDLKIRTSTYQSGATVESLIFSLFLNVWKWENGTRINYARIELFPSFRTAKQSKEFIRNSSESFNHFIYSNEAIIYNWHTGYLKNALQYVNNSLLKNEDHWMMESVKSDELKNLSNNTLYVSDEILIKYNYFKDTENEKHDEKKLFKSYKFKYKILTKQDLSEKIQESSNPIYYLTYIKSETRKYLIILNSVTGEIVYSDYEGNSHNIESKDLAKLAKVIKKKSK